MKKLSLYVLIVLHISTTHAQNVGIGTNTPTQKLDVNGAIKVGAGVGNVVAGTIQWNADKNDFEGYTGTRWVSLTGGRANWGNQLSYGTESSVIGLELFSYMENLNRQSGHLLGFSLALSGDLLVAGAPADVHPNLGVHEAGSVRVFKKTAAGWEYLTHIISPFPGSERQFGRSVSMDGNFLLAGEHGAHAQQGRAYIFSVDNNGAAVLKANLLAPDAVNDDYFGYATALSGNNAAVGAPFKSINGNLQQGKVYFYRRDVAANIWLPLPAVTSPDATALERFGESISMSGNFVAIAAPDATLNGYQTNRGKVFIYQLTGNAWNLTASFTSPDYIGREMFGKSLFLKGDTLLVGATQYVYQPDNGNGRVHLYIRNGNNWVYQTTLTASDGKKSDAFGSSVYLHNGYIAVGAESAGVAGVNDAGKVYVFKKAGNDWLQQAILTASDPVAGIHGPALGKALVITGNTIIAGAPYTIVNDIMHNGQLYFFNK